MSFPFGPGGFEIALEYKWKIFVRNADSGVGDLDYKLSILKAPVKCEQD